MGPDAQGPLGPQDLSGPLGSWVLSILVVWNRWLQWLWFVVVWFVVAVVVVALWFVVAVVSDCGGLSLPCGCGCPVVVVALWLSAVVVALWLPCGCPVVAAALWLQVTVVCNHISLWLQNLCNHNIFVVSNIFATTLSFGFKLWLQWFPCGCPVVSSVVAAVAVVVVVVALWSTCGCMVVVAVGGCKPLSLQHITDSPRTFLHLRRTEIGRAHV